MNIWQCIKRTASYMLDQRRLNLEPSMCVEITTCDNIEVKCTSLSGKRIELIIPKGSFTANFKRIS